MTENKIETQPNNPLHGITLEQVVTQLERRYGWAYLAANININCFKSNPSVKSSLKFLRRTLWAREKVEALYIAAFSDIQPTKKTASQPVETPNPWTSGKLKKS
jgi:uncharacterized protein (DUF2132 family)